MKYFELDKDEKRILAEVEGGRFKSIKSVKREAGRYRQYARQTLAKERNINIRLSNLDLQKIRALAVERGLPYQTLISSLLHQYSSGRVKTRS